MKTFDFFIDTKVTAWYRTPFEIEAKTLEEAKRLAIKFVKDGKHHQESWDMVDDTFEYISVKDNQGQSTEELHTDDFDTIWDNTQD
jgi:hypothetical protein